MNKTCSSCGNTKPIDCFSPKGFNTKGERVYKSSCKPCRNSQHKQYCLENKEKRLQSSRDYYQRNKHKHLRLVRGRQSGLKRATPTWLTEKHTKQMDSIYWLARDLSSFNDEPYEVDHIVPIKGKNICGLHVPWNLQVLPRSLNRSKHNLWLES